MSKLFEAFNTRRGEVVSALSDLRQHASDVGADTLARRVDHDQIQKLEEDRFHLVVVGEFNHGKTSLVNALLGEAALPVGVTPTTAVIHHVHHAGEPEASLCRADGSATALPFGELKSYVVHKGEGEDEAEEGTDGAIDHIDVGYPAELLRDRIVLVDTPGVNDLCLQRADITYKYIPQSDAVLFVIDAAQPLTESERLFLRDRLIGQSRDKIIFVIAKTDIWSDAERSEALAYVRTELGKLLEGPVIFPVSAQRALSGERADSGMAELVSHLTAFLAEERGRIVLDNALGEGLEAARCLFHGIDARRRAAKMSNDEIVRRIGRIEVDLQGQESTVAERRGAIREDVAAIRAWVRRDLDRFVDDVIRQLPELIANAEVDELRQHLASFLEMTFVSWAEAETSEVARSLEELAEKTVALMRDSAHEAAERLSDGAQSDVEAPDIRVDTFGYDLGVAALFSVGMGMVFSNALLGMLMAGAAPVLAYYLKGRVEVETREKAREQAALALREAAAKVAPKIDEMITEFQERLDTWVVEAGKEVHRELLDVLQTANKERAETEPNAERTAKECDELTASLDEIKGRLEGLRSSLWDPLPTAES